MWTLQEDDSQQRAAVGSRRRKSCPHQRKQDLKLSTFTMKGERVTEDLQQLLQCCSRVKSCVTDRPGRCQILWRLNFIKNSVNATSWAVQCPAAGAALIGQAGAAAVARWRDKKAKDCDQTPSSHSHTWPGQAGDSTAHVT